MKAPLLNFARLIGFPRRPLRLFLAPLILLGVQVVIGTMSDAWAQNDRMSNLVWSQTLIVGWGLGIACGSAWKSMLSSSLGWMLPRVRQQFVVAVATLAVVVSVVVAVPPMLAGRGDLAFGLAGETLAAVVCGALVSDPRLGRFLLSLVFAWAIGAYVTAMKSLAFLGERPVALGVASVTVASVVALRACFPRPEEPRFYDAASQRGWSWWLSGQWLPGRREKVREREIPSLLLSRHSLGQSLRAAVHERGFDTVRLVTLALMIDGCLIIGAYLLDPIFAFLMLALNRYVATVFGWPLGKRVIYPMSRSDPARFVSATCFLDAGLYTLGMGVAVPLLYLIDPLGRWPNGAPHLPAYVLPVALAAAALPLVQWFDARLPIPITALPLKRGAVMGSFGVAMAAQFAVMSRSLRSLEGVSPLAIAAGVLAAFLCGQFILLWELNREHALRDLVAG